MPNHCETDFFIEGPSALVDQVLQAHVTHQGELDCDTIIPYPQKFKDLDEAARKWNEDNSVDGKKYGELKEGVNYMDRPKDGFNSGGYEWCIQNWGTKWGTYQGKGLTVVWDDMTTKRKMVGLSFESAWSPASPVFARLSEMYPDLTITANSFECGVGYEYNEEWKAGVQVMAEEKKYRGTRGG